MVNYNLIKDKSAAELCAIALSYYKAEEPDDALRVASLGLEQEIDNAKLLFIVGNVFLDTGKEPLAEIFFKKALELEPERPEMWGSVGRAIDPYRRPEEAIKYLKKSHQMKPESSAAMINLANAYCMAGMYKESYEWAEKAVNTKPDSNAAHDNLGMAMLGLGDYGGFKEINYGVGGKFRPETQYGDEGRWDGTKGQTVIVYGEQGIGDEIIYASCIPDAIRDCKHVIVDCDERLESLFRRSFPEASVYGTRRSVADWPNHHEWDARISIGALTMFYREKIEDFPGTPFLVPDPVRVDQWTHTLNNLSNKPKIGITWKGGAKLTGRHLRSIDVELFRPLLEGYELVDLSHEVNENDLPLHRWDHATLTSNYDDTAGLVAALDAVVTIPASIVHLAGGLGIPTLIMPPERPSWRYSTETMPWYNSAELIHYKDNWETSIKEAKDRLDRMFYPLRKVNDAT